MDKGRMDNGACLYYMLTNEPKGSGELKTGQRSNGPVLLTLDPIS